MTHLMEFHLPWVFSCLGQAHKLLCTVCRGHRQEPCGSFPDAPFRAPGFWGALHLVVPPFLLQGARRWEDEAARSAAQRRDREQTGGAIKAACASESLSFPINLKCLMIITVLKYI